MASESEEKSVTNTLSGTTADTITLTNPWRYIEVTNEDSTNYLYFRMDGTTAVAQANGCFVVAPSKSKVVKTQITYNAGPKVVISIVGNGNVYNIEGQNL